MAKAAPKSAVEPGTETSCLLRRDCFPRPNITKEEARVLKEIRKDQSRIILTDEK